MRRLVTALALASTALAGTARADELTSAERAELARHETVKRPHTVERGEARYVGGVTYTVLDATMAEVAALVDDADALRQILPRTKRAAFVGASGGDRLLQLTQGTSLLEAEYTVRVRRAPSEARFWLDPSRPHGIEDAWGFFRWQPWASERGEPAVLLTYGVLVDVGPGVVRELFEDHLRAALLSVPQRFRQRLAAPRAVAARR